jgi:glutamyl-tRNA reductase
MTMVSLSVSHGRTPAEVLEKPAVSPPEPGAPLARFYAVPSIDEVFVLSTGNRVEVYAAAVGPAARVTHAGREVLGGGATHPDATATRAAELVAARTAAAGRQPAGRAESPPSRPSLLDQNLQLTDTARGRAS